LPASGAFPPNMKALADSEAFRRASSFHSPATVSQAFCSASVRMKSSLRRISPTAWMRTVSSVTLSLRLASATRPIRNVPS